MYFMSPISNITPALVSVAMSRSDSRDSHYSTASTSSNFTSAPMTVSYSTSPSSYRLNRTISNTSSGSSRRPSSSLSRNDSSQWITSPYKSCQLHSHFDEPSSYLSDDDLLYIAPPTSQPRQLPVEQISGPEPILNKKELTTEEQIAMLRDMQEKEQSDSLYAQQQRRQAARRAVRFVESKPRRTSQAQRRTTSVVRKGSVNGI